MPKAERSELCRISAWLKRMDRSSLPQAPIKSREESKQLTMTLTNLLGGGFNRYERGYLHSTDDFGGITVNPYIPMGTGLKAEARLLTKELSFAGFGDRDFDEIGVASPN